jgi:hypothetical protein
MALDADLEAVRLSERPSRMLRNSFSPRLLKKAQMQGGKRCGVRGVLSTYVAAPRERANPPEADRWAFFSSLLTAGRHRPQPYLHCKYETSSPISALFEQGSEGLIDVSSYADQVNLKRPLRLPDTIDDPIARNAQRAKPR